MADYQTDVAALQDRSARRDVDKDTLAIELEHMAYIHRDEQDTGTVLMGHLPPGAFRLYPAKCSLFAPAFTDTNVLISVGYDEYVDSKGNVIPADPDAFVSELPGDAAHASPSPLTAPCCSILS